jgi:FHS family L-fucose permease-like MFS transporter
MDLDGVALSDRNATILFRLCIGIYFVGGFTNSLVGLLVPRLRLLMGLSHTDASLVQLAFHSSYLLFAVPITLAIVRLGYMRGIATGLGLMAISGLGLACATSALHFGTVLLALLALAAGLTFLQIAGNIVVPVVEPATRAVSRMTLLQGFNALGTVLAPLVGAGFLLRSADGIVGGAWTALPFVATAMVTAALAGAFLARRDLLAAITVPTSTGGIRFSRLFGNARLMGGAAAIFCYVGAEVTIGTLLVEFLTLRDTLGASTVGAGRMASLYWAGAMVGRFVGAKVLLGRSAASLLLGCAACATMLVLVSSTAAGPLAAVALIAVGLCNATMYPTIFALSLPEDRSTAPYASMVLCMVVVGGAVIPLATGASADIIGLRGSLLVPALCYVGIGLFAWRRQKVVSVARGLG